MILYLWVKTFHLTETQSDETIKKKVATSFSANEGSDVRGRSQSETSGSHDGAEVNDC